MNNQTSSVPAKADSQFATYLSNLLGKTVDNIINFEKEKVVFEENEVYDENRVPPTIKHTIQNKVNNRPPLEGLIIQNRAQKHRFAALNSLGQLGWQAFEVVFEETDAKVSPDWLHLCGVGYIDVSRSFLIKDIEKCQIRLIEPIPDLVGFRQLISKYLLGDSDPISE